MTTAETLALKINGARLLDYVRQMDYARQLAVVLIENKDRETYEFHFADDSILFVDQITKRADGSK